MRKTTKSPSISAVVRFTVRSRKLPRSTSLAVVNEHQIVLAAEVTVSSPDFGQLQPMVEATNKELEAIGVTETPGWRSLTPATGTKTRSTTSSATAPKC